MASLYPLWYAQMSAKLKWGVHVSWLDFAVRGKEDCPLSSLEVEGRPADDWNAQLQDLRVRGAFSLIGWSELIVITWHRAIDTRYDNYRAADLVAAFWITQADFVIRSLAVYEGEHNKKIGLNGCKHSDGLQKMIYSLQEIKLMRDE